METARMIASQVPSNIVITKVRDKRSYRINSDKLLKTGFKPAFGVAAAIQDLKAKWKSGELKETTMTTNLTWMKLNGWAK